MKKIFFIITILLTSFKLLTSICIPNKNCLGERGECINDICQCYNEFWTLKPTKNNNLPDMFCNYKKHSRFLPLVLEFFLPGTGHFVMKKYLLGTIKIVLLLTVTVLFYTGFQDYKANTIGQRTTNHLEIDERTQLINHNENNINNFEESPKEENNNFNLEMVNNSDYSDDINNGELERPHIANHENIPIPFSKMILNKIEIIFTLAFFVFYIFDLFAYGFAFYRDSNNVPFL